MIERSSQTFRSNFTAGGFIGVILGSVLSEAVLGAVARPWCRVLLSVIVFSADWKHERLQNA
jgi:hypothetical protein